MDIYGKVGDSEWRIQLFLLDKHLEKQVSLTRVHACVLMLGQRDGEHSPFSVCALHSDRATAQVNDALDERQTQAVALAGARAVALIELLKDVAPHLIGHADSVVLDQVARVRQAVEAADGIWIVTPEYNSSYPGVLKNLLDWLSRPLTPGDFQGGTAISGKKASVSGAGGRSAAGGARSKLKELLTFIRAELLEETETGVALGMDAFQTNQLTLSDENEESLQKQVEALLRFIEA